MSSDESITIGAREHGKIGISHCDVSGDGHVSVVGLSKDIEDGEEITFEHVGIMVKRSGDEYTFSKQ